MAKETIEGLCKQAQQAVAQGKHDVARSIYLRALSIRHDAPDVHYGLATVCFLLSDLMTAAHHFKEVTRLDPLRAGAYINLGAVYNRLDQLDEAIPVLRRGIQLDMNRAEGYYNLGLVYRRQGQPDLAIQAYREATRVNPRMADAHYNLGNLYLEKQERSLAIAHYKQALDLRPNWEKALRGLEQVEAATSASQTDAAEAAASAQGKPQQAPRLDPARVIDPQRQGPRLRRVHRETIEADDQGRSLLRIVEQEVEPAIKRLGAVLLIPDSPISQLDRIVQNFEDALGNFQKGKNAMIDKLEKVSALGNQMLRT